MEEKIEREEVRRLILSDEGLKLIEKQADKMKNVKLLFLIQILRELREVKVLLKIHQDTSNCSDNSTGGTDDRKNKHG